MLAINQIESLGARRKFELLQTGVPLDDHRIVEIEADTTSRAGELQALLDLLTGGGALRTAGRLDLKSLRR